MQIKNKVIFDKRDCNIEYNDIDDFASLSKDKCTQIYGVCFYNGKMIMVHDGAKNTWGLVGGTIESSETFEQALKREIQEESNMEVLSWAPIGYQKVYYNDNEESLIQLRAVCKVRPYGEFKRDLGGDVDKIKLIDSVEYKKYFNWGEIGDRIIGRAIELSKKL